MGTGAKQESSLASSCYILYPVAGGVPAKLLTAPAASAPAIGARAMTIATVAFLMAVRRLNSGVYSRVAAALKATMLRSLLGSMRHAAIRQPQYSRQDSRIAVSGAMAPAAAQQHPR